MIKVNLATRKKAPGAGGPEPKSAMSSMKGMKFDSDALRELPIRSISVVLALGYAAGYMLDDYKAQELAKKDDEIAVQQGTLNQLKAKSGQLKQILAMKGALEADEKILRTKIDTIKSLLQDRENPPKMMRSVVKALPETVWLDSFRVVDQEVQFMGGSTDFDSISDFMRNIGETSYFDNVELKTTEQKRQGSADVKDFTVMAKRK